MIMLKKAEPQNRLIGSLPKIGIRPTIDGRMRGVRESLEDQTMNLAKSVKDLIESNLTHSCGLPVECVIADTTIGGVAEAALCAEKFSKNNVGASITVTPCWCYGTETMDSDPLIPKAVWGFNGTERPGAVYLAAVLAGYAQKGLPAFGIYGKDVKDSSDTEIPEDVKEKILRWAKASVVTATLKGKSYLSIGSVSMGIAGSIVDDKFFQEYLGMRNESVDSTEIIRRMVEGIYDKEEYERAIAWTKENCKEGEDVNSPEAQKSIEKKEKDWEFVVKMTIIIRDLMIGNAKLAKEFGEEALGHNAVAAGFQGQRQWTDFYPNGDFSESILNSSFDWNGIREAFVVATENDCLNGVAMLFGKHLSNTPQVFADVRTYWSPEAVERVTGHKLTGIAKDGFIHLLNSGSAAIDGAGEMVKDGTPAMKPYWEISGEEAQACLDATPWRAADGGYFRGGGFSDNFTTKGAMPITLIRVNLVKGLGPVLQLAEGYTIDLPDDVHKTIMDRTNQTWPCTWFVPNLTGKGAFTDVYSVMNNWGANHGSFSYGHIGADLITLASMLRIPVCMHNVDEDKIFRPAAWNAFGMDKEGQDYRACENFGPLYK